MAGFYRDKEYMSKYRAKNKDHINKKLREWRSKNKESIRNSNLKTLYGISLADYDELVIKQNNGCAICGVWKKTFHVDHDHTTGKVRGLLCVSCNSGLGKFNDTIEGLEKAIAYLRKHEYAH